MGLRFDPMGGGKFKEALQQIIQAERQPVVNLENRKHLEEAKLKLFQEFKNKFNGIKNSVDAISNIKKFREFKVELGEGAQLMDVTLNKELVQPGRYDMEITELARRSSIISKGFTDPQKPVLGIGYVVVYRPNGEPWEIFVDDEDASLHGIASLINNVSDAPISAAVIKDASEPSAPWKLILNSKQDGYDHGVDFPEFYFLDGDEDFWIDDDRKPENALIKINDYAIETESNDVADFFPGVGVHLKAAKPDHPFTMTITEDHEKMALKMKAVIDGLNSILEWINKQNAIDEKTDTKSTFAGDTSLQSIEYRLRNILHEAFPAGEYDTDSFRLIHLYQLGVEFGKNGMLTFNEGKFKQAMEKDYSGVAEGISGEFGFAHQVGEILNMYTKSGEGLLAMREKGLHERIKRIDDNIEQKERLLERRAQNLTNQFSRLQSALGSMQQQQQYLNATLGGGGSNLVTQLLG